MSTNAGRGRIRAIQILLTLTAFEFFGPILRDFNATHALNPDWAGHARLHLVWLLGFMFLSGLANLYLIWFRRPFELRNLWLSVLWQASNLGGFWISVALVPVYHGVITMPDTHIQILGADENVFVFTILTILLVGAAMLLKSVGKDAGGSHAPR